ncbi:hypothetical protein CHS0354_008748 [Potamilus streckersoni]|uniref:Uncharacterized protein n=1 Tax=Potamilus streckersoni TaxID=2493646 RepID=A0AAE0T6A7_9BIVA|nr:hypothetical protein CHS0354_008748 [Potamilus streckersoni]
MTACRIVKTFMSKEKDKRLAEQLPLPISTFLRSFYMKNITFYCMLFTKSVTGVYQALGYFLGFLKISLEEESLPEFFHGNYLLQNDFPFCAEGGQVNLFENVSRDTLINARRSFGTCCPSYLKCLTRRFLQHIRNNVHNNQTVRQLRIRN